MENYIEVKNFVVKCRAYPNKEQKEKIDRILQGLRIAYNVTAYEMTQKNPLVTNVDKKDENVIWPAPSEKAWKKEWLDYLRRFYPIVNEIPSYSLSGTQGIFKLDMKKSHENFHPIKIPHVQAKTKKGVPKFHKDGTPVWERTEKPVPLPCGKWEPSYYSNKKPRTSFTFHVNTKKFRFVEGSKSVYITIPKLGEVKIRGWRYDIRYGETPEFSFQDFFNGNSKDLTVTFSKDNCGDCWIVVKLQTVWVPDRLKAKNKKPIGVDVGLKDLAITSDGTKYENKKFKREKKREKKIINRQLSRRQGWANEKFREAHKIDKELEPSNGYKRASLKLAKLERKIVRRRSNHNNNVTADIVKKSSFIGIEDLLVSGMMKNRHLAFSASDAAMSDVLQKLKYKAEWRDIQIVKIGRFQPSSQLCHVCGYRNRKVKDTKIRDWTCPECGTHHDRDINAAINILNFAQKTAITRSKLDATCTVV